ncbi:S8 family serine peptidase [Actinoplanes sp. NPDC051851]|uniref:S8 family serine peptidase n=1 Tax=Actinoplanes sp. NPDC051851 TaxID=3154753 RepID=UPI0034452808
MKVQLRRYAAGVVATGALAAVAAFALPFGDADWAPVTYGLTESPAAIVPATVSAQKPARVVGTTLDQHGRPVVTVTEATDRGAAEKLVEAAQNADRAVGVEIDARTHVLDAPAGNDLYRAQQWGLAKTHAPQAWQRSTGAGVIVAVLDTGVDAHQIDLFGKVLPGWDAVADKPGGTIDPHGHGTHVAGTIAANTGNTIGVSGFAPNARILPVRVLEKDGSGYMSNTAEGIVWATDHGAQVINMSMGSPGRTAAVTNAIAYARGRGVVVVAAAGNERADGSPTSWPAADPGVIAVAATDPADHVAPFSNAGPYVDVAAPGARIMSTYPSALGASFVSMSGTSMASPQVAALAALLKAYRPALTPDQVERAITGTAADLGPAGRDDDYGYGRIDAAAALAAVTPATKAPVTKAPVTTKAPTKAPATTKAPVTTKAPAKAPTRAPSSVPATTVPAAVPATPSATVTPIPATTTSD